MSTVESSTRASSRSIWYSYARPGRPEAARFRVTEVEHSIHGQCNESGWITLDGEGDV